MEQRFQFDEIANLYEAARPGYPDALIEDVVSDVDLKLNDTSGSWLRHGSGHKEFRQTGLSDFGD